MKIQKFTTRRLSLDLLQPQDAQRLFDYRSLPAVYAFQSWEPRDLNDAVRFIERYSVKADILPGEWKQFGIYLKDSRDLIGDCGFHLFEATQAEIGYTIGPDSQRQGYGSEAVAGLVGYLFRLADVHRVIARTDPNNEASINLLRSLRFRQEGYFKKSSKVRGEWQDDVLFAILEEEWANRDLN
jgi:RimJ/RimL family protein N-acetyltransferase